MTELARGYTARAAVTAEPSPAGGTRLTRLRSDGPLALRETKSSCRGAWGVVPPQGHAAVYLVGAAAGPLGGDDLELELVVRAGARLVLRSAATSLALPGKGASRMTVRAEVEGGGHLDFAPEPTVAVVGCDHRAAAHITLARGATLRWYEELILGRHGEDPGRHTSRFDVTLDGVPLLRHELRLDDPLVHGSRAVLGDARAVGSVLLVGPDLPRSPRTGEGLAVLPLAGPGVLITATAPDSAVLRRRLTGAETLLAGLAGV